MIRVEAEKALELIGGEPGGQGMPIGGLTLALARIRDLAQGIAGGEQASTTTAEHQHPFRFGAEKENLVWIVHTHGKVSEDTLHDWPSDDAMVPVVFSGGHRHRFTEADISKGNRQPV